MARSRTCPRRSLSGLLIGGGVHRHGPSGAPAAVVRARGRGRPGLAAGRVPSTRSPRKGYRTGPPSSAIAGLRGGAARDLLGRCRGPCHSSSCSPLAAGAATFIGGPGLESGPDAQTWPSRRSASCGSALTGSFAALILGEGGGQLPPPRASAPTRSFLLAARRGRQRPSGALFVPGRGSAKTPTARLGSAPASRSRGFVGGTLVTLGVLLPRGRVRQRSTRGRPGQLLLLSVWWCRSPRHWGEPSPRACSSRNLDNSRTSVRSVRGPTGGVLDRFRRVPVHPAGRLLPRPDPRDQDLPLTPGSPPRVRSGRRVLRDWTAMDPGPPARISTVERDGQPVPRWRRSRSPARPARSARRRSTSSGRWPPTPPRRLRGSWASVCVGPSVATVVAPGDRATGPGVGRRHRRRGPRPRSAGPGSPAQGAGVLVSADLTDPGRRTPTSVIKPPVVGFRPGLGRHQPRHAAPWAAASRWPTRRASSPPVPVVQPLRSTPGAELNPGRQRALARSTSGLRTSVRTADREGGPHRA